MNSPIAFHDKYNRGLARRSMTEGFTFIEILIVLGIITLIATLVIVANVGQYTREVSSSEVSVLVSALQKARSRSMNNIDATTHGVYFSSDPCPNADYEECYVVFAGDDYGDSDTSTHEYAEKNPVFSVTSGVDEIVFEQLSGSPVGVSGEETIILTGVDEDAVITINEMGLIDW